MVSRWIIKAVVQKAISYLPWSGRINYFFQKHATGGVSLTDDHFRLKLRHANDHLGILHDSLPGEKECSILELGTGWYPVVPVLFYLTASGRVTSIDIQSWMTRNTQQMTILKYRDWREQGSLDELLPHIENSRWEALMDVVSDPAAYDREQVSALIGLTPLIQDARHLKLEDGSVDFICSNNTFEHIPEEVLPDILKEFRRILKPSGAMSHFIDMSDHFAHFDPTISIYHFLKFSRSKWHRIDNRIQPQNRLRFRDYLDIYREAGIRVIPKITEKGDPDLVAGMKVHAEFSGYSAEELAISHAYVITP